VAQTEIIRRQATAVAEMSLNYKDCNLTDVYIAY